MVMPDDRMYLGKIAVGIDTGIGIDGYQTYGRFRTASATCCQRFLGGMHLLTCTARAPLNPTFCMPPSSFDPSLHVRGLSILFQRVGG